MFSCDPPVPGLLGHLLNQSLIAASGLNSLMLGSSSLIIGESGHSLKLTSNVELISPRVVYSNLVFRLAYSRSVSFTRSVSNSPSPPVNVYVFLVVVPAEGA